MSEQDVNESLLSSVEQLNLLNQHDSPESTCSTFKNCGKHVCFKKACTDTTHLCSKICDKLLDCGKHKCLKLCRHGFCPTCVLTSREEIIVIVRGLFQPCGHQVYHNCHEEKKCPPCTYLVSKPCLGGHTVIDKVCCYEQVVLCDKPCGKFLSCVIHQCQRVCHSDVCQSADNQKCTQKCTIKRHDCDHPCDLPCHEGASCPPTIYDRIIKVKCPCGSLEKNISCGVKDSQSNDTKFDVDEVYSNNPLMQRLDPLILSSPIKRLNIYIENSLRARQGQRQKLICDNECLVLQENEKLTQAFFNVCDKPRQLPAVYQNLLCDYTQKNFSFVQTIKKKLTELIEKAQTNRLMEFYTFEIMELDQRIIIHILATSYGIKSQVVGVEPTRQVLVSVSSATSN